MARAVAALALLSFVAGCKRPPTFAGDVAPILYARCAPCHHDGGAAPFSLTSYDDAARRATQIARVTARRYMPPWKATFGVAYANERRLGDDEIATLRRWAEARAPLGRRDAVPAPPAFTGGWALGKPDAVVTLPAYPLGAGGSDEYRNFVVRAPVSGTRWVKAWELQPHGRTIHHAIINIDRNGILRKREGSDGKPGFSGMEASDAQSPDGFYLVWTPGQPPTPPAVGQAWRLDADTDLVVQLHLRPSGKPETVQPQRGALLCRRAAVGAADDAAHRRSADRFRARRALHHARRGHAARRRRRAGALSASALSRAHGARARAAARRSRRARAPRYRRLGSGLAGQVRAGGAAASAGRLDAVDGARLRQLDGQSAQSARAARARAHRRAHRRRDGQRDVRAPPGRRARQGAAARAQVSARDSIAAVGRAPGTTSATRSASARALPRRSRPFVTRSSCSRR